MKMFVTNTKRFCETTKVPIWYLICYQFLCLIAISTVVQGSFNLYLTSDEMKRLLGLPKELYYVREGVVNDYALNFNITVPAHVNALHFTWQTLGQKPLPYSSSIEISDSLAIGKASLNIPLKGFIPTKLQTFQVLLPCTGDLSDEVELKMTLNVTSYISFKMVNNTIVTLRRKKICLEDPTLKFAVPISSGDGSNVHPPPPLLPAVPPKTNNKRQKQQFSKENTMSSANNDEGKDGLLKVNHVQLDDEIGDEESLDNLNLVYIIMGCSLGLVAFLISIASVAITILRTRKSSSSEGAESCDFLQISGNGSSSGSGSGSGCGVSASGGSLFNRPESPHHYTSVSPCIDSDTYTYSNFHPNPHVFYSEILNCNKKSHSRTNTTQTLHRTITMDSTNCKLADKMTIARCKVRLQSVIMEGKFAKIYNGTVLEKDGFEKNVIVKTVNDHSSPVQMALLLHEGLSLVGMAHQHVFTAIGVAAEERVPPFLIYPDNGFRNLKRFLQRCRSGSGRLITAQEIVHMSIQIANGIVFLHRQNVIHGDVAARNCVVDDKLTVKVSDGALSKDLFPDDYHLMGEAESRPVKWMPPEVILNSRTSAQADMWSFGVCLWELATLAQQPYAEIEFGDVVKFLRMGYRLSQPVNSPDELYSSMTRCWTWECDDRPKWTHLLHELEMLHAQLALYI